MDPQDYHLPRCYECFAYQTKWLRLVDGMSVYMCDSCRKKDRLTDDVALLNGWRPPKKRVLRGHFPHPGPDPKGPRGAS